MNADRSPASGPRPKAGDAGNGLESASKLRLLPRSAVTCYAMQARSGLASEMERLGPRFSVPQFLADLGDQFEEWFQVRRLNVRELYDYLCSRSDRQVFITYQCFAHHVRRHRLALAGSRPKPAPAVLLPPATLSPAALPPEPVPAAAAPVSRSSPVPVPASPQVLAIPPRPLVPRVVSVRSVIPTVPPRPVDPDQGKTLDDHLVEFVNDPPAGRAFVAGLREQVAARNADRLRQIQEAEAKGLPHPVFGD